MPTLAPPSPPWPESPGVEQQASGALGALRRPLHAPRVEPEAVRDRQHRLHPAEGIHDAAAAGVRQEEAR